MRDPLVGGTSERRSPRRVAVVITEMNQGGAERVALGIAAGLPPDLWESHLISLGTDADMLLPEAEKVFASVRLLPSASRADPGVTRALLEALSAPSSPTGPGFDLVHAHLPRAGVHARIAARRLRVPDIYTEHNVFEAYQALSRIANKWTLRLCNRVVAVSDSVARDVARHVSPDRLSVVPNGVAIAPLPGPSDRRRARATLGVLESEPLIGSVANLRSEKAQDVLLKAFSDVREQMPRARLAVIGADLGMGPPLKDLAGHLGLGDSVMFLGHRADATELMAGFDVFALSSRAEGLPLALLEAMVRGVPPVCTAVGGVAGVIEDHKSGRLVPAGSPESLSEALLEVLTDREGSARYGAAARAHVELEHSVQAMVDRYAELYEDAVLGTQRKGPR